MGEPAPLISIPEAPAPPGATAEWFIGAGGARLRAALFRPDIPPLGSVILSGGRTEVIEKYFEVIEELLERGFVVLCHDWRGQGLSHRMLPDRLKGHAVGFSDFVSDYTAMLDAYQDQLPKPWLAMSHSMGGCLTLMALAKGEHRVDGAIFSAPMLEINTAGIPYRLARPLAWFSARLRGSDLVVVAETDPSKAPFQDNVLTHDLDRFERNRAQIIACPDLALGGVTWRWIDSALAAIETMFKAGGVAKVTMPVTLVAAGEDSVVLTRGAKAMAARLPDGRYAEIPGAYHEILQEQDHIRAIFWSEFDRLALKVVAGAARR